MALIEYRIVVDQSGTATVFQDVKEIGPNDKIQFVANNADTVIQFVTGSPFAKPGPGTLIQIPELSADGLGPLKITNGAGQQESLSQPIAVTNPNAGNKVVSLQFNPVFRENRRTFHFQCGQMNGKTFTEWGGQGGDGPSAGSND